MRVFHKQLQNQCGVTKYDEKSCDDIEVSSRNDVVSNGQLIVYASGFNILVRSTRVVAQEIKEGLTTQQYNEVIIALAILYLIAFNVIVKFIQGRQSTHVELEIVLPVLPMELFRVFQYNIIALVRKHKKRLVNYFQ
jgi:hypothetical protein